MTSQSPTKLQRFSSGLLFYLMGAKKTFEIPGLLPFTVFPFIICIGIFSAALILGFYFLGSGATWLLSGWIDPTSGFWYDLLYYPLLLIAWIFLLLLNGYLSFILVSIIAIPFHSLLAERTLMSLGVVEQKPFHLITWLKFNLKMFWVGFIKGLLFASIGLLIFVFSFFPGLNIITTFAVGLLISFDTMDYSFEVKGLSLSERIQHFRLFFAQFFGMSSSLLPLLLVPGLLVLFYPFAVVGAAHLFAQNRGAYS